MGFPRSNHSVFCKLDHYVPLWFATIGISRRSIRRLFKPMGRKSIQLVEWQEKQLPTVHSDFTPAAICKRNFRDRQIVWKPWRSIHHLFEPCPIVVASFFKPSLNVSRSFYMQWFSWLVSKPQSAASIICLSISLWADMQHMHIKVCYQTLDFEALPLSNCGCILQVFASVCVI